MPDKQVMGGILGWLSLLLCLTTAALGLSGRSVYASFEIYRIRRAWAGHVAAGLNVLSLAFLLLGPALGLAAFLLLRKASAEDEFAARAEAPQGARGPPRPRPWPPSPAPAPAPAPATAAKRRARSFI